MTDKPRRRFMKQSAALLSGAALHGCAPEEREPVGGGDDDSRAIELDPSVLEALGRIVLPVNALGNDGVSRVLANFQKWVDGFRPVAELTHPYLWTDEIQYGPPHPGPLWAAQLEALDLEAQKRHGQAYREVSRDEQRLILENQLPRELSSELPPPGRARHVAVGLLAYFYETSEANDLCYRAAIERETCRGLESAVDEPEPLAS